MTLSQVSRGLLFRFKDDRISVSTRYLCLKHHSSFRLKATEEDEFRPEEEEATDFIFYTDGLSIFGMSMEMAQSYNVIDVTAFQGFLDREWIV